MSIGMYCAQLHLALGTYRPTYTMCHTPSLIPGVYCSNIGCTPGMFSRLAFIGGMPLFIEIQYMYM